MKFAVGVMLTTFGMFWGAEGAGVKWPGNDASIPASSPTSSSWPSAWSRCCDSAIAPHGPGGCRGMKAFLRFWYDFIIGDDWTIAAGVTVALVLTAVLAHNGMPSAWWLLPIVVGLGLAWSLSRATRRT